VTAREILVFAILGVLLFLPSQPVEAEETNLSEIGVLFLVADGFGWDYFDLRNQFEYWGVNVTTVSGGLSYEVDSCYNKEPRPIVADLIITEVNTNRLGVDFDAVVVPAGGHWASLIATNMPLQLIASAYDQGSVAAAVCIGNRVLARALNMSETFVDGTKVASYVGSNIYMQAAGATVVSGARVVSDNRVVTGGSGGGVTGGGNEEAPAYETCLEIVRAIAGQSHLCGFRLEAASDAYTVFTVTVNTTELYDPLLTSTNMSEAEAISVTAYEVRNDTPATTEILTETSIEGVYSGGIQLPRQGRYTFSVEIRNSLDCYVVLRNVDSIDATGGLLPYPVIIATGAVGVAAMVGLAFLATRRRWRGQSRYSSPAFSMAITEPFH